ncbi:type IV secretory system conjugative DNA transfer family protein [Geoalkalibacter halelectricus]|uniref:type IV secretory system conjugative DNA transfer family protein n=1 Tax=Geoalkalibacter halelectricus TaxID=2847045 RepID=UPI00266EDD21|nr:TraM recognition domain-containing protein [Geoalkalibacter halelectricus]MDO3380371.1 TraM recognition domain-containing protein [Geoalkalibacter halelectricus]
MFLNRKKKESGIHLGTGVNLANPGRVVDIFLPDSHRQGHTFFFGTTRVGKTRAAEHMIEQDIMDGKNIALFDPKGDQQIFTKIFDAALRAGREKEIMLVTPVYPEHSAVIDPMAYYFMQDELVGHVISGIQGGKDPFFRNIAKEITTAVITANILLAQEEGRMPQMNFDAIRNSIRRDSLENTMVALQRIGSPQALSTAGIIGDILNSPQDYYAKVSSTLRTTLNELSTGNIGQIIGQAESNRFMEKLENGERVILIVHTGTMLTREAGATLGKVILSMIQSFIGRVYLSNKQKVDPALAIYIDEAQSLLYPGIEELTAKAGSANVMLHLFAQSVNQIYDVLGREKAKAILDTTNTKIFMRATDAETSEYVVKHFGTHSVLTGIYSTAQVTTREVEQDIIKVRDVLDLQAQQFYLNTYSGVYRGTVAHVGDPQIQIVFPDAPVAVRQANQGAA